LAAPKQRACIVPASRAQFRCVAREGATWPTTI
jgi:hypothetical protein